jgi:hypothetical protein
MFLFSQQRVPGDTPLLGPAIEYIYLWLATCGKLAMMSLSSCVAASLASGLFLQIPVCTVKLTQQSAAKVADACIWLPETG